MKSNLIISKTATTIFSCLVLVILLTGLTGCFHSFYKTNTKTSIDSSTASKLISEKKYFIIHFIDSTKALVNVYSKNDSIYGKLTELPHEHSKYLKPPIGDDAVRVKVKDKPYVLLEVHLYTIASMQPGDSLLAAPLSSIYRTDIYEFNEGATRGSYLTGAAGLAVVAILVGIITCNCYVGPQ